MLQTILRYLRYNVGCYTSRLICYAKSIENGKMLAKSILEGPYQYKLIQEPGEPTRTPSTAPYSCPQTEEELTADEAKQVVYDDQAMQLLLLGLLV
ncbi:hypothetical protein Tco_0901367 [Tanacetum coccineum]